jgi:hypothetical protein
MDERPEFVDPLAANHVDEELVALVEVGNREPDA